MALGSTYLGQGYLGQGYPGSGIQGTGAYTFVASISPVGIGPSSAQALEQFSAGLVPTVSGIPFGLVATFTTAGAMVLPIPSAQLTATFGTSTLSITVTPPTSNPGTIPVWILLQTMHRIGVGVGVPPTPMGNDGDFFFREDGTTGSRLYARASGAWSAVA